MLDVAVITGLSGAGRSQVANALEDLGWFVIDNLPVVLIPKVAELAERGTDDGRVLMALVAGRADPERLRQAIVELRERDARVRLVFLDASTEVLVRRYEDTRRRHPLIDEGASLAESIELERRRLTPIRETADVVIDTSSLNVHQLRARMTDLFGSGAPNEGMQVNVTSFGFKHGVPTDADLVLDLRFLPNPHWVEPLRPLTGLDAPVQEYLAAQPITDDFFHRLVHLLDLMLPAYENEGRSLLTIAIGCTGGRHRSVALTERLSAHLGAAGFAVRTRHRDVDR